VRRRPLGRSRGAARRDLPGQPAGAGRHRCRLDLLPSAVRQSEAGRRVCCREPLPRPQVRPRLARSSRPADATAGLARSATSGPRCVRSFVRRPLLHGRETPGHRSDHHRQQPTIVDLIGHRSSNSENRKFVLPIRGLFAPGVVFYLSALPHQMIHHAMSHTRYLTKRIAIAIAGRGASPDVGAR